MKILVIADSYPPDHSGGYGLRCLNVVDGLRKRGYEICVITTVPRDNLDPMVSHVYKIIRRLHRRTPGNHIRIWDEYRDLKVIDEEIREFRPDVIYLWNLLCLARSIFPYLAEANLPVVYDEGAKGLAKAWSLKIRWLEVIGRKSKSPLKNNVKQFLGYVVYRLSGGLFKKQWLWPKINVYFNSELGLLNARQQAIPLDKMSVIHSGINIALFPYKEPEICGSTLRIVHPGRMEEQKGVEDSILLVRKIKDLSISAHLTIVGEISSVSYLEKINRMVKENGVTDRVEYFPPVSQGELVEYYHNSDFCFFPSYYKQGLSRIPLEAMACGSLVVTYGNEGSNEIIRDHQTGIIVPEGNIDEAVIQIAELVKNPEQKKTIIQSARRVIEEKHAMEPYIDSIETFLYESIKGGQ